VRRLSSVLLTIEAIVLVFPTFLGGSSSLAPAVWPGGECGMGLAAAWWLLLAYFYTGPTALDATTRSRVSTPITEMHL
jgi:hypothetical protein